MGLVAWCRGRDDSEATESSPLPATEPAATATLSGRGEDRYTDGPALKADESSPLYTLAVGDAAWWRACAWERAVAGAMRPPERQPVSVAQRLAQHTQNTYLPVPAGLGFL